jgi:hypothetical protein
MHTEDGSLVRMEIGQDNPVMVGQHGCASIHAVNLPA